MESDQLLLSEKELHFNEANPKFNFHRAETVFFSERWPSLQSHHPKSTAAQNWLAQVLPTGMSPDIRYSSE
jgi:hypothetical protein